MAHVAVKRGEGPIDHALDQAVLDRIVVNIIHMPLEVVFVPNSVFPVTPLPEAILTLRVAGERNTLLYNCTREVAFDCLPAVRVRRVPTSSSPMRRL
jgi:hypothetical protein